MNHNKSQNLISILAVSQNLNYIELWPKYCNTIESLNFCQFPALDISWPITLSLGLFVVIFFCRYNKANADSKLLL